MDSFRKLIEISTKMGEKLDKMKEDFAELQDALVDMVESGGYSEKEIEIAEKEVEYWRNKIWGTNHNPSYVVRPRKEIILKEVI
jgi:hypothetical protein